MSDLIIPQHWKIYENNKIVRNFKFPDYKSALEWTVQIAMLAEEVNHHPEIMLSWGEVFVAITTHDNGNTITDKDIDLANDINDLADELKD